MIIEHEVFTFTGVYWLGQCFTVFPWLLQKSYFKPATFGVIQLISEGPEIKSPLLYQV